MYSFAWLALWLVMIPPVEVVGKDGRVATGSLRQLTAAQVVFDEADSAALSTGDLVEIRIRAAATGATPAGDAKPGTILVRLVDGSILMAHDYRVERSQATIELATGVRVVVPTKLIDLVRLQTSGGAQNQQWLDITKGERTGDTIVVRKEETLDFVAGVAGDVTDEHIHFDVDGDKVPVKRTKVEGVLYFHAASDPFPASFCSAQLTTGGSIEIVSATIADDALAVQTPAAVKLSLPWSLVSRIRFKTSYLSDLEPESVAFSRESAFGFKETVKPSDALFHRPRLNEGFEAGQPLKLAGQTFSTGIALYGGSEIVFRLPEGTRQLQAIAGIDDSARPEGQVKLQIWGDDRLLLEQQLSGREPPVTIQAAVSGANRIKIVALSIATGSNDRLVLGDPRLSK